jgi:serine/threonine protein kinase
LGGGLWGVGRGLTFRPPPPPPPLSLSLLVPSSWIQVMELMTGGELFDRIVEKEKYTEDEARIVVLKLARAIEYCHNRGIVHRDLKVAER